MFNPFQHTNPRQFRVHIRCSLRPTEVATVLRRIVRRWCRSLQIAPAMNAAAGRCQTLRRLRCINPPFFRCFVLNPCKEINAWNLFQAFNESTKHPQRQISLNLQAKNAKNMILHKLLKLHNLEPQTTIYKWLFQLDDEPNLYIGNGCLGLFGNILFNVNLFIQPSHPFILPNCNPNPQPTHPGPPSSPAPCSRLHQLHPCREDQQSRHPHLNGFQQVSTGSETKNGNS